MSTFQVVWVLGWMFENWDFFVGCLCGCKIPLLHGQDLSRLGFNSPRGNVCVFMFLNLVCVFFSLVSKCRHGHTFGKQIYHCFQTPKANFATFLKIP